jgi:NADPH2 dehydrogenase
MAHLFSPLTLHGTRLRNRIVLAARGSGHTTTDGSANDALLAYYAERASGVGLAVSEPVLVLPPTTPQPHLGIYSEAQVASLRHLVGAVQAREVPTLLRLHCDACVIDWDVEQLGALGEAYIAAARRARATGAAGVLLALDGGDPLQQLLSLRLNTRHDAFGGPDGRLRLGLDVVEGIRRHLGPQALIALRLAVEATGEGSLALHEGRVMARRFLAAGASLIEVTVEAAGAPLARFPGWRVPLAASLKPLLDAPVMVGGGLDDPLLADSVVREGSADLVVLGRALHHDPYWPHRARGLLGIADGNAAAR